MSHKRILVYCTVAFALVLAISNYLVTLPLDLHPSLANYLTYGAFSYPLVFVITDLINRLFGFKLARVAVYLGFAVGVPLSMIFNLALGEPSDDLLMLSARIAFASGAAFIAGQLCDIWIFHFFRQQVKWWIAPLISSIGGAILDSLLFFSLAFAGIEGINWFKLSLGDLGCKLIMVTMFLPLYRYLFLRIIKHTQNISTT